jgi:beta-glucosidase-like glycosyl hydrolase
VSSASPALLLIEALRLDREPVDEARRRALEALELGVGGFILFGGRAGEVALLLEEITAAAGRALWLAADLERGAGQQFAGLTSLPPPAALARAPDPVEAARVAGEITGREARELGINWVLAPVLDLDISGDNPIVGTRSFGSDPGAVARLGRAWIDSCQSQGPAACAKHFPGHGRTVRDSHLELPVVEASPDELYEDLEPFVETAGVVATVMAAHVTYPSLSPGGPASLRPLPASRDPAVLRGLLRDRLGFEGLVVSDALIMGGFADPELAGSAAVEAVTAGCDLLLYPHDTAGAAEALRRAADEDSVVAEVLSETAARSGRVLREREAIRAAPGTPGGDVESRADELAERSIVIDRSTPAEVGIRRGRPVIVRALSDDRELPGSESLGEAFTETLRGLGWEARLEGASGTGTKRGSEQVVILLASSPQAFKGHAGLAPETEAALREELRTYRGEPACLVVLAHRRLLERLGVPGLCAWSPEPVMERAAARRLALEADIDSGPPHRE